LFNQVSGLGVQDFGNDAESESIAGFGENLQAVLTQPLEGVRRSAWLERSASKELDSAGSDNLGDRHRLLEGLNRARPRYYGRLSAADLDFTDAHNRVVLFKIAADELVRLGDPDGFPDAGEHFEVSRIDSALVSGDADRGSSRAGHRMRPEAKVADDFEYFFDLSFSSFRFHYYEHGNPSIVSNASTNSTDSVPG